LASLKCSKEITARRAKVFEFLTDPKNLPELLKKDIDVGIENIKAEVVRDSTFSFSMTRFGFSQQIKMCVLEVHKDSLLTYKLTQSLFDKWVHTMKFEDSEHGTLVTDIVEYQLPMGLLGYLLDDLWLKRDMTRVLENRLILADQRLHGGQ